MTLQIGLAKLVIGPIIPNSKFTGTPGVNILGNETILMKDGFLIQKNGVRDPQNNTLYVLCFKRKTSDRGWIGN